MLLTSNESDLLGTSRRPLRLRVRGGAHDGQVLRLSDAKCLIGSDDRCGVKLPGAGAVECWILRGAAKTVVRSLGGSVRLNGATIDDAVVRPGDKIQLGPYTLDVLKPSTKKRRPKLVPPPDPSLRDLPRAIDQLLEQVQAVETHVDIRLDQALSNLDLRHADLVDRIDQLSHPATQGDSVETDSRHEVEAALAQERSWLADEVKRFQTQQEDFEAWRCRTQQELQQQLADLNSKLSALEDRREQLSRESTDWERTKQQQLAELNRQHDLLVASRLTLEQQHSSATAVEQRLATERAQLVHDRAVLDRQRQELEATRLALEAERTEWTETRAALVQQTQHSTSETTPRPEVDIAELERRIHELAARETELHQRETQLNQRHTDVTGREANLDQRAAELSQREVTLLEQQAELHQREAELAANEAHLSQRLADIEARHRALDDREARLAITAEQESAAADETERLRAELESQQAALTVRLSEIEETRRALEERVATLEDEAHRERELLDQVREELAAERAQFEREQTEWLLKQAQHQTEIDTQTRDLYAQSAQLEQRRSQLESLHGQSAHRHGINGDDAGQSASAPQDLESDDVFSRLKAVGILKREDDRPVALSRPEPAANSSPTSAAETDDDDSIHQYMRTLLERSRQPHGARSAPPESPTSPVSRSLIGDSTSISTREEPSPAPEEEGAVTFVERPARKRPQPAELTHDMTAMRELANLSAQAALALHQRRQQQHAFGTKITIFVISLAASIFGLVSGVPRFSLLWFATLAPLIVAAIWGAQLASIVFRIARTYRRSATTAVEPDSVDASHELSEPGNKPFATPSCLEDEPETSSA